MATIEIKTLSPVHVGSGRFLQNKTEYVFGKENIGIVDEAKVLGLIGVDRIPFWVASIEKGESLVEFIKSYGITPTLQSLTNRVIALKCEKDRAKNLSTLKEQIHNGQGLAYLPGSSIKGAIRSALFSQIARSQKNGFNDDELLDGWGDRQKITANKLEKQFFGSDPNHDIFRFLRIGDAYFRKNTTVAFVMDNINIKGNSDDPEAVHDTSKSQLVEAIGAGKGAELTIKLDGVGMKRNLEKRAIDTFPESFNSIEQLFALINTNTQLLINEEIAFWTHNIDDDVAKEYIEKLNSLLETARGCSQKECVLRMAHGSGWTFITGNWVKEANAVSDDLWYRIVNAARPGNQSRYKDYPFPKSRRISNNIDLPGFVKLSIVG
jgi:CRISPR type III-A-associated RAMP protein Csm5